MRAKQKHRLATITSAYVFRILVIHDYPKAILPTSVILFNTVSAKFSSVSLQDKTTRDDKLKKNPTQVIEAIERPATV